MDILSSVYFQRVLLNTFALLAIMNPFGNLPIFISMTEDFNDKVRSKLFRNIVYTAAIIVVIFAIAGSIIMQHFFQVDISELRIAGGLVLVVMGLKNLLSSTDNSKKEIEAEKNSPHDSEEAKAIKLIVPMAFPMLVGPGTLSTIIILENESGFLTTMAAIAISFILIFILFSNYRFIARLLGKLTLYVLSRIMQVFIMAIGVKMLVAGVKDLFHLL